MTEVIRDIPGKLGLRDRSTGQTDLDTIVGNQTKVLRTGSISGCQRNRREKDVVLGLAGIVVHIQTEAAIQHAQLKTTLDGRSRDRTNVRIGKRRRIAQCRQTICIDRADHIGLVDAARIYSRTANLCPGRTDLGEINELGKFHQLGYDHTSTYGRIKNRVETRIQHREPIVTSGHRQIICVVIIQVHFAEHRIGAVRGYPTQRQAADICQIPVDKVGDAVKIRDHPLSAVGGGTAVVVLLLVGTHHHVEAKLVLEKALIVIDDQLQVGLGGLLTAGSIIAERREGIRFRYIVVFRIVDRIHRGGSLDKQVFQEIDLHAGPRIPTLLFVTVGDLIRRIIRIDGSRNRIPLQLPAGGSIDAGTGRIRTAHIPHVYDIGRQINRPGGIQFRISDVRTIHARHIIILNARFDDHQIIFAQLRPGVEIHGLPVEAGIGLLFLSIQITE